MKGIELSERFYEECGKPMLEADFSEVLPVICIGLVGSGSECYGFDDEISQDHDFEPAFCIFVPDDIDDKILFELERAYAKLPKEFLGLERCRFSAVGGKRHGVIKIGDFYEGKTGSPKGELSLGQWLTVPEFSLSEAVNGVVFADNYGEFTRIREALKYYPEEIRLKKLAGNLLLMGQAGQYNYKRCIIRGDTAAAQMSAYEFVKSAINAVFLLNKNYAPYYKWSFKALKALPLLNDLSKDLEMLISADNQRENAEKKVKAIEEICTKIGEEINRQGILSGTVLEMEAAAYGVNNRIANGEIRNLHVLAGV